MGCVCFANFPILVSALTDGKRRHGRDFSRKSPLNYFSQMPMITLRSWGEELEGSNFEPIGPENLRKISFQTDYWFRTKNSRPPSPLCLSLSFSSADLKINGGRLIKESQRICLMRERSGRRSDSQTLPSVSKTGPNGSRSTWSGWSDVSLGSTLRTRVTWCLCTYYI